MVIIICVLMLILCGCSAETNKEGCPDYFAPVVQELKTNAEAAVPVTDKWWGQGLNFSEQYDNKVYTCNIYGKSYQFDLQDKFTDEAEWHWSAAGTATTSDRVFTRGTRKVSNMVIHSRTI